MLSNILVPIDGSEHAEKAIDLAANLALSCKAKVVFCHAWQPGPVPTALRHMAEVEHIAEPRKVGIQAAVADVALSRVPVAMPQDEPGANARILEAVGDALLHSAKNAVQDMGVSDVQTVLTEGDPAEQILNCAKSQNTDLIVIGSRGLSDIKGLLIGSVSHKVVQLATCPVMVAK